MKVPAITQSMEVKHKRLKNIKNYPNVTGAGSNLLELNGSPDPIPFGLIMYEGAKSYRLPRIFVESLLKHPVALAFAERCKTMLVILQIPRNDSILPMICSRSLMRV